MRRLLIALSVVALSGFGAAVGLGCGSGREAGMTGGQGAGPASATERDHAKRKTQSLPEPVVQAKRHGSRTATGTEDRAPARGGNKTKEVVSTPDRDTRTSATQEESSPCPDQNAGTCAALDAAAANPAPAGQAPKGCPAALSQAACVQATEPDSSPSAGPAVKPGECPSTLSAQQCEDLRLASEKAR